MEKIKLAFGMYIWISLITIIELIFYGSGNIIWSLFADVKLLLAVLVLMIVVMLIYLTALWLIDKFFDLKYIARVDIKLKDSGVKLKAKGENGKILGILVKGLFAVADELGISKDRLLIALHDAARVDEEEDD